MSVGEVKEMDHAEFVEWQVFYDVEAAEQAGESGKRVVSDPSEISQWFAQTA